MATLGFVSATAQIGTFSVPSGEQTYITIPAASFVTGHRYMIFVTAMLRSSASTGRGRMRLRLGGTEDASVQTIIATQESSGSLRQWSGMTMWTPPGAQDLTITAAIISSTTNVTEIRCLGIDLDSGLIENVDWFFAEENTAEPMPASFGSEVNPASLTFTPDGTSDYATWGYVRAVGHVSNDHIATRLQNITGATTVSDHAMGSGSIGAENHAVTSMGALLAPAASSLTLETQYRRSANWFKSEARIFVLRISAFTEVGRSVVDPNANAAVATPNTELATSFVYTPDANGTMIILCDMKSHGDGGFTSIFRDGTGTQIEFPPATVRVNAPVSNRSVEDGNNFSSNPGLDSFVGPNIYEVLTGLAATPETLQAYYKPGRANSANARKRQTTLIAIGTDFTPGIIGLDIASVNPISPTLASREGGTRFTISGNAGAFDVTKTYRVHVGPNADDTDPTCYAGQGLSTAITPTNATTLECFLPDLTVSTGTIVSVFVEEIETGIPATIADALTIIEPNFSTAQFSMRRLFAPNRKVGNRNFTVFAAADSPKQLLRETDTLDTAPWASVDATATINAEDPFGGTNGWALDEGSGLLEQFIEQLLNSAPTPNPAPSLTAGVNYTMSCYVKASNRTFCSLDGLNGSDSFGQAFNLTTGVVGTTQSDVGGLILGVDIKVVDLVTGWFRISITFRASTTETAFRWRLNARDGDNLSSYQGLTQEAILMAFPALDVYPLPRAYREAGANAIL